MHRFLADCMATVGVLPSFTMGGIYFTIIKIHKTQCQNKVKYIMDINNIDLGQLTKDELERVKFMLNINRIQADIEASRQGIEESRAAVRRMEQSIEESRAIVAKMHAENDKYFAETQKLRKESQWFPWLQMLTTFLTGGVVVLVLTKLFS